MRCWFAIGWLVAALACNQPTGPTVLLNQEFTLAPGETAKIADTAITVKFVGVMGDSRCPADVVCIQGGDALVRIEVLSLGAGVKPYDLHTGTMQPVVHDGLTISLVQLVPYPFSARTVASAEYRATLRVTR